MTLAENKNYVFIKLFSIFMALYPLLCIYKGISSVTVGDLLLIFFFISTLSIGLSIKYDRRSALIFFFVVYSVIVLCINLIIGNCGEGNDAAALFLRIFKFAFYMICVLGTGSKFLDRSTFKKAMYFCGVVACAFLMLQYVLYYAFGKIILGQLPGVPLHLDEYSNLDYEVIFGYQFRPSSFFLEPALFVHYLIVALVLALFDKEVRSRFGRMLLIILFTVSIVMSTAGQGILYLVVVYFAYAFKEIKNKARILGFTLLFVCIALIGYNNIDVLQNAVDRLIANENAADARLGSYIYCFELSTLYSLFGNGYGVIANGEYMAGAAYVWYGCGIIGLSLIIMLFACSYEKASCNVSKVLCVVFFIMFFGTGLFYNYMVFWYFSLMMANNVILGGGGSTIMHSAMEKSS